MGAMYFPIHVLVSVPMRKDHVGNKRVEHDQAVPFRAIIVTTQLAHSLPFIIIVLVLLSSVEERVSSSAV